MDRSIRAAVEWRSVREGDGAEVLPFHEPLRIRLAVEKDELETVR
jgi:hypothetical protein